MFDFRQLQVFVEVARTGSFTAAAGVLGYTQPAVSYQMRQLERAARTPLVIRVGRGVRLTEAGHRLAAHADIVLSAVRAAEADIGALTVRGQGCVRIAAFQSGSSTLLPVMHGLSGGNDGVRVILRQVEPPAATALIVAGDVDLGLLCDWENEPVAPAERHLERHPLLTDRRCVVVPVGHPVAALAEVDFATLGGETWVVETARDRFVEACARAGFRPRIAATADDQVATQQLVAGGVGIALANELAVTSHLDSRLVAVPLAGWPRRRIYAAMLADMSRVPAVATVLTRLREAARQVRDNLDIAVGPRDSRPGQRPRPPGQP